MTGRTVVITGSTSGIGRAAAAELSRAGARVVMAVRNTERGEQVAREIGGDVEVRHLDLTDLSSVRAFASGWEGEIDGDDASGGGRIDVLILNAGVMAVPEGRTKDGFETQIGTNFLGHFALAGLLVDHVRDRVVTLSSGAHRMGKINLEDLNWEHRKYQRWPAYGQSKLADLMFMFELQRRLAAAGSPVRSVGAHPGYAATELQSRTGNALQNGVMSLLNRVIAQSGEQGAWPTLYAATQDLPGGSYVGPDGRGEMRGHPTLVASSDAARDEAVASGLWELAERLTGVKFEIPGVAVA
jgi:NAD(P)-dependent dehydrogenase (short-subunit alcohol dehydrogenase family)